AEAAIQAGCRFFFGYPITPQNQIPEYMAKRLPKIGGCFLQAESEVAAINMVYGAASAGVRVMTSSSSPGVSLKQEGISYIAGANLPCVIVNIMRGGPGLGGIQPSQSDYYQSTRGGGHGDYRHVVYAPSTVQEAAELMMKCFDTADRYRMPVMLIGDGIIGQIMEPVDIPEYVRPADLPEKTWATTGCDGSRPHNVVNSLFLDPPALEKHNNALQEAYKIISGREVMDEQYCTDDAEYVVVAYGTMARIARKAVDLARAEGIAVGMVRPITLWPFPEKTIRSLAQNPRVQKLLTVEMSCGQMVDDVRLCAGVKPVEFYGRTGGVIPQVKEVLGAIRALKGGQA
ncbi:MAG: 3-methyl-2-oxobutanoate dehydrogenase subunit VorB, partial [Clostridiales bacterium]|nr:3-methyl-2-oxobutanoate dehydrogenase subunit VorB [Clostridiales bacterium]